jgi:glycosyltransferase involved in cell wall biosynthesis
MTLLGARDRDATREAIGQALAVVVPSLSYEGFPMTVVEAFAAATPVIASRIGSVAEIVADGRTGWHVPPGDAAVLAAAIDAAARDGAGAGRRGDNARARYLADYTPEASLAALEAVYAEAVARRRGRVVPALRPAAATEAVHVG